MASRKILFFTSFVLFGASNTFAAPPANYYNNADTSTPTTLRNSVHAIIDDHTRFPYTSSNTDTWDLLEDADQDADNASNVTTIYRNASYVKQGGGNSLYNREHSWPSSYGFPNDNSSNYPYTDAHHLFIADISYNSSRGNEYYDNCSPSCSERVTTFNDGVGGQGGGYPGDSNWSDNNSWEVWSERRGDIARAMFYMDIRYEGGSHSGGASEPDLRLTNNTNLINTSGGSNASVAYMGLLSTLLQWHAEDPVDADERNRNDVVFSYQGNRNPFVDNPQWVACVYQNQCSGGATPTPTPTPTPPSSSELNNGDSVSNINIPNNQWRYFTIAIPNGASNLRVSISGGNGDADLYTRLNAQPTSSSFNCRPFLNGNNEVCTFPSPSVGVYHIGLNAFSAVSNVTLSVSYDVSGGGSNTVGEQRDNLSGSRGQWRNFSINVPAGATQLNASISGGTGDADLYIRRNALPTTSTYQCRPFLTGNNESCTVNNPAAGTWYISIRGFEAYRNVDLSYSYTE